MPGMTERHATQGPKLTYFPWTSVTGGRLCEPDPAHPGYIQHASDGSTTVIGMAMQDATNRGEFEPTPWTLQGLVVNSATPRETVCYTKGVFWDIETTGAVAEGQRLVAAGDGLVRAYNPTVAPVDDPAAIVGKNVGPAVTAAGKIRVEWNH